MTIDLKINKIFFLTILAVLLVHSGFAQIQDDSTKLIYGAHSTKYVLEEDIFGNRRHSSNVDTSISDFHNYDFLYNGKLVYQNLGNLGTPLGNIYFNTPTLIGKNFGYYVFEPYATDPYKIRYYDTKSPYSDVTYIQGTNGQQLINAEFSRNIRRHWNAGFDIKRFTSNLILGFPQKNQKQSSHTSFLFYTRFFTKDSTYQALANYTIMDHQNFDTGGIVPDTVTNNGETTVNFFGYQRQNVYLQGVRSLEKRSILHLYHQVTPWKKRGVQFYHIMDINYQSNRFRAPLIVNGIHINTHYFPGRNNLLPIFIDSFATNDRTNFNLFENKVGIKGNLSKKGDTTNTSIFYYRAYYRSKFFNYTQPGVYRSFSENFIGGFLKYDIPKTKGSIEVDAEYLFYRDRFTQNLNPSIQNDYRFTAEYVSKYFKGGFNRTVYSPYVKELIYFGNNFEWNNQTQFIDPSVTRFFVNGTYKWKHLEVNPEISHSSINNYIYYNIVALPVQNTSTINYFSADLFVKYYLGKFHLENLTKHASASSIIQVPSLYNHTRFYYQSRWFRKVLLIQAGVDIFYKSAYFANQYMPITQQYYINQGEGQFKMNSYWLGDVFINVRLKSANGFIKFSNVNQRTISPGYFITPFYPGMYFNFEFGIRWLFFD